MGGWMHACLDAWVDEETGDWIGKGVDGEIVRFRDG
jgi:hypothetical protein